MTHNKINYIERLHKNGYRLTTQRQLILDAICEASGHATVGEIYYQAKKLDEGIDRSTVYRSLDLFVKLKLVILGESIDGERVYELVKEDQHHHLVCSNCERDIDIDSWIVEDFYENLRNEYDFQISMDHLMVFGICGNCSD
jgi:Fur family ferric uptake transcriptional regulator